MALLADSVESLRLDNDADAFLSRSVVASAFSEPLLSCSSVALDASRHDDLRTMGEEEEGSTFTTLCLLLLLRVKEELLATLRGRVGASEEEGPLCCCCCRPTPLSCREPFLGRGAGVETAAVAFPCVAPTLFISAADGRSSIFSPPFLFRLGVKGGWAPTSNSTSIVPFYW